LDHIVQKLNKFLIPLQIDTEGRIADFDLCQGFQGIGVSDKTEDVVVNCDSLEFEDETVGSVKRADSEVSHLEEHEDRGGDGVIVYSPVDLAFQVSQALDPEGIHPFGELVVDEAEKKSGGNDQ
jgi:hypothetical protein